MSLQVQLQFRRDGFSMDLECNIPAKGITGVFGASGSGKTSLLRAIAGFDRHKGAQIVFQKENWQGKEAFVPPYKRPVGYVFQEPSLFGHLSVRKNILYAAHRSQRRRFWKPWPRPGFDEDTQKAIELLGAEAFLDKFPHELSGGEAARAAILRALASRPGLLLLDEPLSALDANRKRGFLPWLVELSQSLDLPMLYVSHELRELARISDHLLWIKEGRLLAHAKTPQVLTNPAFFLEQGDEACFVIEGTLQGSDEKAHLHWIESEAGRIAIPKSGSVFSEKRLRLLVFARDVSLSLSAPRDSSIRNVFPASIVDFYIEREGSRILRLRAPQSSQVFFLARITEGAFQELGLCPNKPVFVQIKGVAVLR